MRIIAGEFRGRKLLPPEAQTTRPITDRVKQSLFDILTPLLPESVVYDCFAGTGSLGLEALSRGAARAVFFEADRSALVRLRRNIQTLGIEQRSQVIAGDLFKWFAGAEPRADVEIVFLDPPYRFLRERTGDLKQLAGHIAQHLAPGGLVVFRHDAEDRLDLPPLALSDRREYGGMAIELLTRQSN